MPDFDLLVRGASPSPAIGVLEGKIAALDEGSAREEINAEGLLVFPGVIDAHVHFNDPGRSEWEGIATGSRACAAGGTTTFFDMPLNSTPPVVDADSFKLKLAIAERDSWVDFGLWGGLIPGKAEQIGPLKECGVVGLKAFMSDSGIPDFPKTSPALLRAGMSKAAEFGLLVAVHAEIDHPELQRGHTIADYLASRPIHMELEAIRIALDLAGETRCALHIVHVSSAAGVALIAGARQRGVDVTCETCPHYLVFNEEDVERLGALAKCAPPVRSEPERKNLLGAVRGGDVHMIGSDHSPAPVTMKSDTDFFKIWGGISGCQHLLGLLFDLQLDPESISLLAAGNVGERFGVGRRKGSIRVGCDADFAFIDPTGNTPITPETLHYRHRHTPYAGKTLRGRVVRTILRGETVMLDGNLVGAPQGRLVTPLS